MSELETIGDMVSHQFNQGWTKSRLPLYCWQTYSVGVVNLGVSFHSHERPQFAGYHANIHCSRSSIIRLTMQPTHFGNHTVAEVTWRFTNHSGAPGFPSMPRLEPTPGPWTWSRARVCERSAVGYNPWLDGWYSGADPPMGLQRVAVF